MFTGIVQGLGNVHSIDKGEAVWTFGIDLPDATGLERGASVAINGVCLTATEMDDNRVSFDVITETLSLIHI